MSSLLSLEFSEIVILESVRSPSDRGFVKLCANKNNGLSIFYNRIVERYHARSSIKLCEIRRGSVRLDGPNKNKKENKKKTLRL